MSAKAKISASIDEIKRLQMEASSFHVRKRNKTTSKIVSFLLQTALLEGVLVNYGFALLKKQGGFSALIGKRKNRYGYDNAINDLFLLRSITEEEFKQLENYKNKRNEYLHGLLLQDTKTTANEVGKIYEEYENLVDKMIKKLKRKLDKPKS